MELVGKLLVKILITGGSGFLGSALACHLLNSGHELALILRPSSDLCRLNGKDKFFDLGYCSTDYEIDCYVKRVTPDVVIHTACSYGRDGETALQVIDSNIRFGITVIESIIRANHKVKFINTSTALNSDVSLYSLTKNQFSKLSKFLVLKNDSQVQFINVLLQHLYGPNDHSNKFTTYVLNACSRNDQNLRLTKGEQIRDFVYIKDVIAAFDTLLTKKNFSEKYLDVEIGSGVGVTVRKFVETVHRLTNSRTKLVFGALPYRNGEDMNCVANNEIINSLGWHPRFSLESGLHEIINLELKK